MQASGPGPANTLDRDNSQLLVVMIKHPENQATTPKPQQLMGDKVYFGSPLKDTACNGGTVKVTGTWGS